MDINVAATAAIGDYLTSEIQNTRILFNESPVTGQPLAVAPAADTFVVQLPAITSAASALVGAANANAVPGPAAGTRDSGSTTIDGSAASPAAATAAAAIAGSVAASAAAAAGPPPASLSGQHSEGVAPVAASASSRAIGGQTPRETEEVAFTAGSPLSNTSNASELLGTLGLGLNVNTYA